MKKAYGALEHFDYSVLDTDCICPICEEWRATYQTWLRDQEDPAKHQAGCRCPQYACRIPSRSAYLAAMYRRDLYCESSWHASENKWGRTYMEWLTGQVVEDPAIPNRTRVWWETVGCSAPLHYWFKHFNRRAMTISAFASGGSSRLMLIDLMG